MPFVELYFPCRLGADENHIAFGPTYPRFLRAAYDNSSGTASNVYSAKSGRPLDLLSMLERGAAYAALLEPDVLDIREQYPAIDYERHARLLDKPGRNVARSEIPTFDLLLTRRDELAPSGYRLEAIYVKPFDALGTLEVQRRIEREQAYCHARGWTWRLCTERELSNQRTQAAKLLATLGNQIDLDAVRDEAKEAAAIVKRRADDMTFSDLKKSTARTLSTTPLRASQLIAAAALHGFICVDLNAPFQATKPLVLMYV